MNKYLNYNDFKEIENYCIRNCKEVLLQDEQSNNKNFRRGMYKGFIYFKKFNQSICKNKKRIKQYEYYNLLKDQKNNISNQFHPKENFIEGITEALYKSLNFIASL